MLKIVVNFLPFHLEGYLNCCVNEDEMVTAEGFFFLLHSKVGGREEKSMSNQPCRVAATCMSICS